MPHHPPHSTTLKRLRILPRFATAAALTALLTLAAGCGQSSLKKAASAAPRGKIIEISDSTLLHGATDTIRFGRLHSGEIAVLRFHLHNASSRPTAVVSTERSCGCTTLEFDAQPIAPGDARQVTLTFDSRGERGWQLKVLDITLAGGQRPLRLFVEADIK